MNDLISRQSAIDAIEKHIRTVEEPYQLTDTDRILNHAFDIAASCVYNLPSAQPEIIRCKDCKHLEEWSDTDGTRTLSCDTTYDDFGYHADVTPYHYCGYTERNEE